MVKSNWFLPEAFAPNGAGVPLSVTTGARQFSDLPLHAGQPCCALVSDGVRSWRTTLSASGICLFAVAPFPVRVTLPGGAVVVAEIQTRGNRFLRSVPGATPGVALAEDRAIHLRIEVDGRVVQSGWSEWTPSWMFNSSNDLPWFAEGFQVSAGWFGNGRDMGGIYAHLLPYWPGIGGQNNPAPRASDASPREESRQFGVGVTLVQEMGPSTFSGPAPIRVETGGSLYTDPYVQPCKFFTGHVIPLTHTLPFVPDSLTASERVDAFPDTAFGWFDHPSAAAAGQLPYGLTTSEADVGMEWEWRSNQVGPRQLGALANYPYSDHAAVRGAENWFTNLSPDTATNLRFATLRVKMTVDGSRYWPFAVPFPGGQFVVESDLVTHGAFGEWATSTLEQLVSGYGRGMVRTVQSHSADAPGSYTYRNSVQGFAMSVAVHRHTLGSPYLTDHPGGRERVSILELRLSLWLVGTRLETGPGVYSTSDWTAHENPHFVRGIYLRQADVDALLAGQKITVDSPYSPDALGFSDNTGFGSVELTAIGPQL